MADLDDLRARLVAAKRELTLREIEASNPESTRLLGKIEGIGLAISYLDDAVRVPAPVSPGPERCQKRLMTLGAEGHHDCARTADHPVHVDPAHLAHHRFYRYPMPAPSTPTEESKTDG